MFRTLGYYSTPISVDINTRLSFEDKLTIGATYRTDGSFAGMASVTFLKVFTFGYAYEVATKSELARANNTNELLLRSKF